MSGSEARALEASLDLCEVPWARKSEDRWEIGATPTGGGRPATIETAPGGFVFRARLVRLRRAGPKSLAALSHFVGEANSALCLVRLAVGPDEVAAEVTVPVCAPATEAVSQALRGLRAAYELTAQELKALLSSEVAQCYLEFHRIRRTER